MKRPTPIPMPSTGLSAWILFVAVGCRIDPDTDTGADQELTVNAALSEQISLVVRVDWETEDPSTGILEFGETEDLGTQVTSEAGEGTHHSELMLGLLPETEYFYRVLSTVNGGEVASDIESIWTGALPPVLPEFTQTGDPNAVDGYIIVPLMGATWAVAILDDQARYRWYYIPEDQDLKTVRAQMSLDRKSLLFNAIGQDQAGQDTPGSIMRVSMDGSEVETLNDELIPNMHHDFCELSDGSIAALSFDENEIEGTEMVADRIVEIHPDGSYEVVFNTLEYFDPSNDEIEATSTWWTHGNALTCDLDQDVFYYGIHNFSSILKIDRSTGLPIWGLGGIANDFTFPDDENSFYDQHNFHVLDDGILVFSNERTGVPSRVVEFSLDEENLEASLRWSYTREDNLDVAILGDVTRRDSGHTHINWAIRGVMEQVNAEGESLWEASVALSHAFGYSRLLSDLYPSTD